MQAPSSRRVQVQAIMYIEKISRPSRPSITRRNYVTKSLCSIKGEALIYKNSLATENGVSPIARYSLQIFDTKHGKWIVERGKVEWKEESNVKRGVSASPRNQQGVSASPIIK